MPREHAQVYSAHATIAVFQGVDDANVARFEIARYLRYARADGERAEEPRHELALELGAADAHTAMLADEADGGAVPLVVTDLAFGSDGHLYIATETLVARVAVKVKGAHA